MREAVYVSGAWNSKKLARTKPRNTAGMTSQTASAIPRVAKGRAWSMRLREDTVATGDS